MRKILPHVRSEVSVSTAAVEKCGCVAALNRSFCLCGEENLGAS
jgi:hypothetical protein